MLTESFWCIPLTLDLLLTLIFARKRATILDCFSLSLFRESHFGGFVFDSIDIGESMSDVTGCIDFTI